MHCYQITQCDAKENCPAYGTGHTEHGECRNYAPVERLLGPSIRDRNGTIVLHQIRCHQCAVYLFYSSARCAEE
ncbi:MAG: hypothetical protein AB1646_04605 [Thermodesulfobacteriota bacterium]